MKYRWLEQGKKYIYSPAKEKDCTHRRGQFCELITVPTYKGKGPKNCRVRFDDEHLAIVPSGVLKNV